MPPGPDASALPTLQPQAEGRVGAGEGPEPELSVYSLLEQAQALVEKGTLDGERFERAVAHAKALFPDGVSAHPTTTPSPTTDLLSVDKPQAPSTATALPDTQLGDDRGAIGL